MAAVVRLTVLCGGVGGAKLALGLYKLEPNLSVIANTGDDFLHYGLTICPDIDTILYTLSGKANAAQGWGREHESFHVQEEMQRLDEDLWFTLGDKDIALHLVRSRLLGKGLRLTDVIELLSKRLGLAARVLPMSDAAAPTKIDTCGRLLNFQDYFVRQRCAPSVQEVCFSPQTSTKEVIQAIESNDAIVICPSNPLLSVGPILATKGVKQALTARTSPTLAVSPIIGGAAVKGPTVKILTELGMEPTSLGVARHYQGLIDIFIIDVSDSQLAPEIEKLGMRVCVTKTMMNTLEDKVRLAKFCIQKL